MAEKRNRLVRLINILVIISIITCFLVVLCVGYIFCSQHIRFSNAYADACQTIATSTNGLDESINLKINTLESLQEIQRNSAAIDLIIFLYSFLSSIFVGIGAYYLKHTKDNAEEATDNFNQAKSTYNKIRRLYNKSHIQLDITQKFIEDISGVKDNCLQMQEFIEDIYNKLKKSQSLLDINHLYHAADVSLSIVLSCEKLSIDNKNEKTILAELMPRLNDSIQFICKISNEINMTNIVKNDINMLIFILHEISKSINRCNQTNELYFSTGYTKIIEKKLNKCISKISV